MSPVSIDLTGASSGIGRAVAIRLAEAGAVVGIHYRGGKSGAQQTLAAVRATGSDGHLLAADLADPQAAAAVVDDLVQQTGRLDILINNAGTPVGRTPIEDCSLELWNQVLAVNLTGTFVVTRQAIPHLRRAGQGVIVNNLSLSVQTGGAGGAGPYAVAKGGLQVFTRTLARELAPEVRVNSIMPGVIETPHHEQFTTTERLAEYRRETPLGRNGTADEVADVVLMLASDAGRFVNGAIVDINGGRFLR